MATFTSAITLAASQKRRTGLVVAAVRLEHKKLAQRMADRMIDLASGTISSAELASRGHPFGRKKGRITLSLYSQGMQKQRYRAHKTRPVTPTPLLPINRQSGRLIRSLRIIPEHYTGGQSYRVQFTAPHAKFVLAAGGTKSMVARGYRTEIRKQFRSENSKTIYQMRLQALRLQYGRG